MIAVAPNGARKTKREHPNIPISPKELASTAAACLDAGACLLHLHVRDAADRHTLDANRYKEATAAIRKEVGDELIIQITTEAVGIYQIAEQIQAVKAVRPEAVSLAIKEFCPEAADERRANEREAADFFAWLYREHISPQYILYSAEDIRQFNDMQARGLIPGEAASVLLVLGRYTENQQSNPDALLALLKEVNPLNNWWLCAFGATEALCMQSAIRLGGHCRVGFENNQLLADGSTAADNASSVSLVASNASELGRAIATPAQARELLGMNTWG